MTVSKRQLSMITLNWVMNHLYSKKKIVLTKKIIDRPAYYRTCQKSLKGSLKLILSLLQNFPLICVVLQKTITLKICS